MQVVTYGYNMKLGPSVRFGQFATSQDRSDVSHRTVVTSVTSGLMGWIILRFDVGFDVIDADVIIV